MNRRRRHGAKRRRAIHAWSREFSNLNCQRIKAGTHTGARRMLSLVIKLVPYATESPPRY